jgi:hypothetical protein
MIVEWESEVKLPCVRMSVYSGRACGHRSDTSRGVPDRVSMLNRQSLTYFLRGTDYRASGHATLSRLCS